MKLKLIRTLIHLFTLRGQRGRYFSKKDLHEIAQAIASSEAKHRAEIRVAIESSFSLVQIWQNLLSRGCCLLLRNGMMKIYSFSKYLRIYFLNYSNLAQKSFQQKPFIRIIYIHTHHISSLLIDVSKIIYLLLLKSVT